MTAAVVPAGDLQLTRLPPSRPVIRSAAAAREQALRYRASPIERVRGWARRNAPHLNRGLLDLDRAERHAVAPLFGVLWMRHLDPRGREVADLGLASLRVVTTAGVGFIVDAFQNLTELENMKYHGIGTGTTAEATSDTALVTELTTGYSTDNTRPTGTTTESAANIYRTVATVTVDAAAAITEHGIFSQAATGGGVLLDRSVFAAVNLAINESIQFTYDLTVPAGG